MTKALKNEISAEDRQFNRNKWLFSVSGIGRDMSYQLIASFLLTYIQFGMTLSIAQFTTISLLIGVAGRIWDAINDPMMGAIIEGTHMKFGKFRPWILLGAVLTGIIIVIMFNVQNWNNGWNFVIFMIAMYLLWESAFTMNDIGYWSMLASLSSKKDQRNSATMLTVVFAGVGAFAAQGGISFLYPGNVRAAFSWISIAIAAIFVAMQVVMVLLIKERPRNQMEVNEKISLKQMWDTIRHNDQILWMTLSMLFYNIGSGLLVGLAYNLYYLEIGYDGNAIVFIAIFGIFNIGAQVFYPKLAQKLGRKRLQFWSIVMACVGYVGIALLGWTSVLPFNLITLSVFGVLVFVGQAMFYMSSIINMTNCVEYNEYKRGERNEAVVSTLRPFMAKFADAIKYGIVTLVLVVSSVYGLSQNISTLEVQKGHFDRMETVAEQTEYILGVQKYYVLAQAPNADLDALTSQMQDEKALSGKQLDANYVVAMGDVAVFDSDDKFVGFINDVALAAKLSGSQTYVLKISGKDAAGNEFNAANTNFKGHSSTAMRLWVRAGVTVIPILFVIAALIVQKKKFIIDEEYYDMMIVEINKRRAENGDPLIGVDEPEAEETATAEEPAEAPAEQPAEEAPAAEPAPEAVAEEPAPVEAPAKDPAPAEPEAPASDEEPKE